MAVEDSVRINIFIEMIFLPFVLYIQVCGRSQVSLVRCCRCDRTCIHQRYGRDLSALQLASLTVREVSRSMADGERIVRRSVPCAEARSAECGLHNSSCLKEISYRTVFHKFHVNRHTCGVNAECKFICSDISSFDDVRSRADILKSAAGTSRDDALIHIEPAVPDLPLERIIHRAVQADKRFLLHIMENIRKIFIHLVNGINIARMERHRDHRFDLA